MTHTRNQCPEGGGAEHDGTAMPRARDIQFDKKTWSTIATIILEIWGFLLSMIAFMKASNLDCPYKRLYRIMGIVGMSFSTLSFFLMVVAYIFMLFAGNNYNARFLRSLWWIFARPMVLYTICTVAFFVMRFVVPQPTGCVGHLHSGTLRNSQVMTIFAGSFSMLIVIVTIGLLIWLVREELNGGGSSGGSSSSSSSGSGSRGGQSHGQSNSGYTQVDLDTR